MPSVDSVLDRAGVDVQACQNFWNTFLFTKKVTKSGPTVHGVDSVLQVTMELVPVDFQ